MTLFWYYKGPSIPLTLTCFPFLSPHRSGDILKSSGSPVSSHLSPLTPFLSPINPSLRASNMVLQTPNPMHVSKSNRRRERPGARSRHAIARKDGIQFEVSDGLSTARDSDVILPFEYPKPSPLLRQNFDQSWQRWKTRDAQQKLKQERARQELEIEQQRLFGGDLDDDELRRLGIIYDGFGEDDDDDLSYSPPVSIRFVPAFRTRSSRRSKTRSQPALFQLPPFLASSFLADNAEIARLMASSYSHIEHANTNANAKPSTIQHRTIPTDSANPNTPLSLPPTPSPSAQSQDLDLALSSICPATQLSASRLFPITTIFDDESSDLAWSIISTNLPSTPASESETWVLLSDDS